mmetsp:Transcript_22306/g.32929  ORF Transcript_22306/g.32929 Transcript_22306/m.32929 type:complete len:169 (-) Transcript_22306:271-777(-)|eukprot:CAMPEP_0194212006 /NCGR_PEP_ID=MMETSP0156-20130528/11507_1 /TAXON_ID=33649 /ORGANISM="Thalassionema nitzschioides, Strain L26-B" /LENGTH=168 /DNA_ID=CAMNT_0038939711 /DNA_START=54 /DNA_END=560 /DNA_ORIENTATION=-
MTCPQTRILLALLISSSCQSFLITHRFGVVTSEREKLLPLFGGSYFEEEDERDREFARIRRGRRQDFYERDGEALREEEEYRRVVDDLYERVGDYDDDTDEDYDGVIPNPLLDNIDPEGSSERSGELFADPNFWKDIAIFLLTLNLLDNLQDGLVFDAIDFDTWGIMN